MCLITSKGISYTVERHCQNRMTDRHVSIFDLQKVLDNGRELVETTVESPVIKMIILDNIIAVVQQKKKCIYTVIRRETVEV